VELRKYLRLIGGLVMVGCGAWSSPSARGTWELDASAVTVGEYTQCVRAGVCVPRTSQYMWSNEDDLTGQRRDKWCTGSWGRPEAAMNCVSWSDAVTYCAWSGGRLPRAEEWRPAARRERPRVSNWTSTRYRGFAWVVEGPNWIQDDAPSWGGAVHRIPHTGVRCMRARTSG
jgi:formylglycine-generating enzyme required for sulfatase activity